MDDEVTQADEAAEPTADAAPAGDSDIAAAVDAQAAQSSGADAEISPRGSRRRQRDDRPRRRAPGDGRHGRAARRRRAPHEAPVGPSGVGAARRAAPTWTWNGSTAPSAQVT